MDGVGADSMDCDCSVRDVQDLLADEKTPHDWQVGELFIGSIILFGANVGCHPM